MKKEEDLFKKRMIELSKKAYDRGIYIYSDFLNTNELSLFSKINKRELYSTFEIDGGYNLAQRQMIKFIPDAVFYEENYPISIIEISPKSPKFSSNLSHRDYLGSILSLGIQRNKIGDILVDDSSTYVIVNQSLSEFICDNLSLIRNTYVRTNITNKLISEYEPPFTLCTGTVQSIRLDSVLAIVLKESRSRLVSYIENGKVFVNSKLITTNAYQLSIGDYISVRGFGKFYLNEIGGQSKKGKYHIEVKKYI